jgi:hypothetical protein
MKAGPYCGYSLEQILDIKKKEQEKIGKFFWGYSGVFCRPNKLQTFVSHAHSNREKVYVLFSETKSSYDTQTVDRFSEFSKDRSVWNKLPGEVLLVGNSKKPHFAVAARNLMEVDYELDIGDYCTISGMFPDKGRYLNDYFRYRVDKACGYYLPKGDGLKKNIKIKFVAELEEPYSVYIR